ncbi:NlpC/P60 family protein [Gryllotalpicola sp.]|uniref:NlpC/P60 family protein n=1 Tax=Gryllotalpicola sp. TaxID=1932787 RepID=UPI0026298960|nr:NlpC/P60 family protein [Gryllotalpicola sp.]
MTIVDATSRSDQVLARVAEHSGMPSTATSTGSADGSRFSDTLASVSAGSTGSTMTGAAGATLPQGVTGDDIVAAAQQYLGTPYVFGGDSTSGMDCSGLVKTVLGRLGMQTGHLVSAQSGLGTAVPSLAQAQPGDLIVENGNQHIQIYAGNGKVIEAPRPGENVVERAEWLDPSRIQTIRRVTTASTTDSSATDLSALLASSGLPAAQLAQFGSLAQSLTGSTTSASPTSSAVSAAGAANLAASIQQALSSGAISTSTLAQAFALSAQQSALSGLLGGGSSSGLAGSASTDVLSQILGAGSAAGAAGSTGTAASTISDLAGMLSALGATPATPAVTPAAPNVVTIPATTTQTVPQQLTSQIITLVQQGNGNHSVIVKIVPEQLGPVTVNAHLAGGQLSIGLAAPTDSARDALNGMLGDLRRDLAGSGISADLSLGASTSFSDLAGQAQQGGQRGESGRSLYSAVVPAAPTTPSTTTAVLASSAAAGESTGLDVIA